MSEIVLKKVRKASIDFELILACAVIAFIIAIMIVFSVVVFADINLYTCNQTCLLASFFSVYNINWLLLLFINC